MPRKTPDVIREIATDLADCLGSRHFLVAVTGTDGVGKTTLADQLAGALKSLDVPFLRASIDGFHNPKSVRYHRGQYSPVGFYRDSFDLVSFEARLLQPLRNNENGDICVRIFDHKRDVEDLEFQNVATPVVALIDGIFLLQPGLRAYWDFIIQLEATERAAFERLAKRDALSGPNFKNFRNRYLGGQRIYRIESRPLEHANLVLDMNEGENDFLF